MKTVEFESTMMHGGQITLPPEIAGDISVGEHLRVLVMWDPSSLDSAWRSAGRRKFEEAYCAEDSIYEQLLNDLEPEHRVAG